MSKPAGRLSRSLAARVLGGPLLAGLSVLSFANSRAFEPLLLVGVVLTGVAGIVTLWSVVSALVAVRDRAGPGVVPTATAEILSAALTIALIVLGVKQ